MQDEIPVMLEREAGAPDHVPQVVVGFGFHPMENPQKSAEAGHPVYDNIEFFKLVVPGDKQSLHLQPATERDRAMFPRAYAAFKQREDRPPEGIPIEEWPQITRAQALTYRAMNIPTVEALAAVHDGNIDKLGHDGRTWRTRAIAFLAQAKDTAAAQKYAAENETLKDQIAGMQQQINELAARVPGGAVPMEAKRKRGPKPKVPAAEPEKKVA